MALALIVDDDPSSVTALAELVHREGFETVTAETLAAAKDLILTRSPDLILTDLVLPDGQGTELLHEVRDDPAVDTILVTGNATVETAVEAMHLGAYDYLTKPVDVPRLKTLLARFASTKQLKKEVAELRDQLKKLGRFGAMVGTSPPMQRVYDLADRVAPTDATVLLIGESGTGKELLAATVHRLSRRRGDTFLALNCGAISANLMESELFGHEKGAFTGAHRRHQGCFEQANGGTLFLDEITEMPVDAQVKLLRVLENGIFRRVGGTRDIQSDVRVIAATNRDAAAAVEDGNLRSDLYFRLKVFPIELPPLRDRRGDIELLTARFLARLNKEQDTEKIVSPDALELLESYNWPGNVRELENVVRRAFILADQELDRSCLPSELGSPTPIHTSGTQVRIQVGASLDAVEQRVILTTLEELDGDKRKAAEILGVSLKTLYNRLKRYRKEGIIPEQ